MKKDWEERSLGDICEFRNGLWKGKKPPFIKAKVIRMTNFTKDCEMNNKEPIELEVEKKQFESRNLTEGDLLIEKSGGGPNQPVGRVVRFKSKDNANYSFSNFTTRMRIIDQSNISSKYLHKFFKLFYLTGKTEKFQKNSTNIRNLQLKDFKEIQIPLPSIQEQKRIVEKLDTLMEQIDKAIQNVEQNIQNAEDLFQSYLNEIFSQKNDLWINSELGKIYDVRDGTHDSPKYQSEGYPLVTSKNLKNGKIVLNRIKYISFNDYNNINKRSRVDVGDVLFAMIGTIGNPVVIIEEPNFAIKNVALFKVSKTQNSHFLKYFLDLDIVRNKIQVDAKGSTQKFVGLGYLRRFRIDIPSKEIQDYLVSKINEFKTKNDLVFSNYKLELESLNNLKKSILEKAFNGEL